MSVGDLKLWESSQKSWTEEEAARLDWIDNLYAGLEGIHAFNTFPGKSNELQASIYKSHLGPVLCFIALGT